MKTKLLIGGLLAIQFFLTACSGILSSEEPAKQTYVLEPIALLSSNASAGPLPTLNLKLDAVPGLDSDRIQAIDSDARLNRYANARWPDFLPEVLTSVIRRSLLSSGQFASVTTGSVSSEDLKLSLEIQQFYGIQATRGTTSRVSAEMDGVLSCKGQDHRIHLTASESVSEERLAVVVKAHQNALDSVTRQLWDQIGSHCD